VTINSVSIPYPDFKLNEIIDPEQFDINNAQMVNKINEIKTLVNKITDGVTVTNADGTTTFLSGGTEVNLKAIAPFASTKLQAFLEEVIARLQSTTDASSGADLIGSTAIAGVIGTTVQAQLESLKAILDALTTRVANDEGALSTHKTSADHDSRYYTEAEIDTNHYKKIDVYNKTEIDATTRDHKGTWQGYTPSQVKESLVQQDLDAHKADTAVHVDATEKVNWDSAYLHTSDLALHVSPTEQSNWDSAYNETVSQNTQTAILKRGLQKIYSDQTTPAHLKKLLGRTLVNHMGRQGDFVSQFNRWNVNLTIDTSVYKFGTSSGKIDNSAGTAEKISYSTQRSYLSGKRVLVGVWAKAVSGTPQIEVWSTGWSSADALVNTNVRFTKTVDNTWKFYWKKFDLTANTEAYWRPRLDVDSFGTANDVVNFDGMVVAELTSSELSYAHTQAEIEAKYGYPVNSVQHTQNPYFIAYGKNLLPPFTEWTLHANAEVVSPYDLKLVATGSSQQTTYQFDVLSNQAYVGTVDVTTSGAEFVVNFEEFDANGVSKAVNFLKGTTNQTATISFTTNSATKYVIARLYSSASGTFTFTNPQLELGSVATAFEPANNDHGFIETKLASNLDGTVYDTLYQSGTELRKVKRFELDKVLDGTLAWSYSADYAGYKRVRVIDYTADNHSIDGESTQKLVGFDGKILKYDTLVDNIDEFYLQGSTGNLFIALTDTDTGWGDAYTAVTADEIKAYFNGWKADAVDAGGKPTSWVSVVDGTQPSTDSLAYVSANKAPNYTPYSLTYQLANEKDEPVSGEFALNFHDGDNAVEFGEGVIVREPVTPYTDANFAYINSSSITSSQPKYRPDGALKRIYQDADDVTSQWSIVDDNGRKRHQRPLANHDPTAQYTVTYLLLDKHEHTVNVVESELSYNTNLKTVVDQLVTDQTDTQAEVDAIQWDIEKRLLKGEGERVESGSVSASMSAVSTVNIPVTFKKAYSSTSNIQVVASPVTTVGGKQLAVIATTSLTTTGVTLAVATLDGTTTTGTAEVRYIVIGK
jgi:hypothetical protein